MIALSTDVEVRSFRLYFRWFINSEGKTWIRRSYFPPEAKKILFRRVCAEGGRRSGRSSTAGAIYTALREWVRDTDREGGRTEVKHGPGVQQNSFNNSPRYSQYRLWKGLIVIVLVDLHREFHKFLMLSVFFPSWPKWQKHNAAAEQRRIGSIEAL